MSLQLDRRRSPRWGWPVTVMLAWSALARDAGVPAEAANPGTIDPSLVAKVVAKHSNEIRSCFEAQVVFNPQLSGTLVYDFEITADGAVGGACRGDGSAFVPAISYEAIDELTVCIGLAVKTWKFPAPKGGSANVSWPFSFKRQAPPLRSPG
jgi:hypothetical protein